MKKNPLISTGMALALLLAGALFWLAGCSAPQTGDGSGSAGDDIQGPSCTLVVRCDTVLGRLDELPEGKAELIPADGLLIPETQVALEEGDTPFSLLQELTKANGVQMEADFLPGTSSAYVEGIGNLYAADCGDLSGWMYFINGESPSVGCSDYQLSDGDRVEFAYTCDMGADLGLDFSSGEEAA